MGVSAAGPLDGYLTTDEERAWAQRVDGMAAEFARRAAEHDREASFGHENVDALIASGYTAVAVPRRLGGGGAPLRLVVALQERLAMGDPSTALAVGWHQSMVIGLRETDGWPRAAVERIFATVVGEGGLINSCASERETGSPSRGGLPTTTATAVPGGYRLDGRKTWSTLSPRLTWFIITAALEDGRIGEFLVERTRPGLRVEETWNSMSLRASGSHDVVLEGVQVPTEALMGAFRPPQPGPRSGDGQGPLLHVPACYLGVAMAARRDALRFAREHRPSSLPGPIADLPAVQDQFGKAEVALAAAHALLYETAAVWDATPPDGRPALRGRVGAAKVTGTETAIAVVDTYMRVVGALSLSREHPFERYYRDVRAGLHNPPMADAVLRGLGRAALGAATPPRPDAATTP
jgi:alkylation response protein AidB-like acyl-CoA dehydrogenase